MVFLHSMSASKPPHNVLITFVSKDLELNRIGITELVNNKKYGGLSKVYLLYDGRTKDSKPQDGWAESSVRNKDKLYEMIKPLIKNVELVPVDPDNVVVKIKDALQKEIGSKNTVFVDATSLRRVTISRITLLSIILGAKLFLVVPPPDALYDPKTVYVKQGSKEILMDEWAARQVGEFELLDIPRICPKLNTSQRVIIRKLAALPYDSLKSLLQALRAEQSFSEASLRDNLRKLKKMEMVNYEKTGKSISKVELGSFGKLVSDVIL